MAKICIKCNTKKPEPQFALRSKKTGVRRGVCKSCHAKYLKRHYQKNKEMYLENARQQNAKLRADNTSKIVEHLQQHPCIDCGEKDPIVLEFDHVRGKKFKSIASMVNAHPWRTIQKEIKKCDIRCANCHKRKTAKTYHWRKAAFLRNGKVE